MSWSSIFELVGILATIYLTALGLLWHIEMVLQRGMLPAVRSIGRSIRRLVGGNGGSKAGVTRTQLNLVKEAPTDV